MIFKDTQAQLQANNLCRFEKPYAQPIVTPADINLQGILPNQGTNNYSIEVKMYDCTGNTFIADVTSYFRVLFATSIYNFRYFNLQLREFTDSFNGCFTFKVKVTNGTTVVFNKITEPYKRLYAEKRCYIEVSEEQWDLFSLEQHSIIVNGETEFQNPTELPPHFEPQYQQGTQIWYLYFDCDEVETIGFSNKQSFPLATPLAAPLGGIYLQITLYPIYAVYAVDETGCKLPMSRFESTFNCYDNISKSYYGDAKTFLNYPSNDENLKYTNSQWIETELKKQPTEIKKEVSFLGRTQRVDYIATFRLKGLIPFPQWKVDELEALFSGKHLFIDAVEYILRKDELFKADTIRCTCNYLLDAELEKEVITNEYSCNDDCNLLCYYFVITGGLKDQTYYDENGNLIGHLFQDLLNYFNNLPDVISVEDYSTNELDCQPVAIVKIDSYGFVPSFIYYWEFTPTNRIFVKRDKCDEPETLCDGVFTSCEPIGNVTSICQPTCYILGGSNITSECIKIDNISGSITANSEWVLLDGFISEVDVLGFVDLSFSMENTTITDDSITEITNVFVGTVSPNLTPSSIRIINDGDRQITIQPDGKIYVTSLIWVEDGVKATLVIPLIHYSI